MAAEFSDHSYSPADERNLSRDVAQQPPVLDPTREYVSPIVLLVEGILPQHARLIANDDPIQFS